MSPSCEYATGWVDDKPVYCRRPTMYWYPAQRAGSTMALCKRHAAPFMATACGLQHRTRQLGDVILDAVTDAFARCRGGVAAPSTL